MNYKILWGRRILGTDKVTFESRSQGSERDRQPDIWGKNTSKENNKCKGLEGRTHLYAVLSTAEDRKMNKLKELKI